MRKYGNRDVDIKITSVYILSIAKTNIQNNDFPELKQHYSAVVEELALGKGYLIWKCSTPWKTACASTN